MTEDEIGTEIVDVAVRVRQELGPGLLETVYEAVVAHELRRSGLQVGRQLAIPVEYQGLKFEEGFRADILVENKVMVELKCVERLNNAHKKQLLTCLQLTDKRLGYLLNFGETLMEQGIVRTVVPSRIVRLISRCSWREKMSFLCARKFRARARKKGGQRPPFCFAGEKCYLAALTM